MARTGSACSATSCSLHGLDPVELVPLLAPVLGIEPEAGYVAEPFDTRKLSAAIAEAAYRTLMLAWAPARQSCWSRTSSGSTVALEILERIAHDQRACMMLMTARPGVLPIAGAELVELEALSEQESSLLDRFSLRGAPQPRGSSLVDRSE